MANLVFEFHYDCDLSKPGVVDVLQQSLIDLSPRFAAAMQVTDVDRDPAPLDVNAVEPHALSLAILEKGLTRGETYAKLAAESPGRYPRPFGHATVHGGIDSMYLRVAFDAYTPAHPIGSKWLWSNTIGGRIERNEVDGLPSHEWVDQLAGVLAAQAHFLWGGAFLHDEFLARNLHSGPDGTYAIGRDIRQSLPGLYWLNAFGAPYVTLIGPERFRALGASANTADGGAKIVTVYGRPDQWDSRQGRYRHREVLDHLGRQYFFDRSNPQAATTAPDYGLPELGPDRALQAVVSDDGTTFTIIPDST